MRTKKTTECLQSLNPTAAWMHVLPTVSAYVRSLILNYHDSEDVIQNIAVVFADKFPNLDPSRDHIPWVLKISRYEVVNYYRDQKRSSKCFDADTLAVIEEAYQAIDNETQSIQTSLNDCIQQLHDRPRHVLELRYFREMKIPDISRQLGISSNAIYVMLSRIRSSLAKCVQSKMKVEWNLP